VGKRGPQRAPTEVLEARGSRLVKERKGALDVQHESLPAPRPDYPPNLKPAARPYFDGICGHLEEIKRLRPAFAPAMVILANMLADYDRLGKDEELLDDPANEIDLETRVMMSTRIATRKKDLLNLIRQYMDRFYMNPGSMEGVHIPKEKPNQVQNEPRKAQLRRGI
jgi:hypothetical protein